MFKLLLMNFFIKLKNIKKDGYKSMIDDCGVRNDKFEDIIFPQNNEILFSHDEDNEQELETIGFLRLPEIYQKERYDPFVNVI